MVVVVGSFPPYAKAGGLVPTAGPGGDGPAGGRSIVGGAAGLGTGGTVLATGGRGGADGGLGAGPPSPPVPGTAPTFAHEARAGRHTPFVLETTPPMHMEYAGADTDCIAGAFVELAPGGGGEAHGVPWSSAARHAAAEGSAHGASYMATVSEALSNPTARSA